MKFKDVYAPLKDLPCTEESQCRVLYDWILKMRPAECLELGFLYGKTSCVIAAALDEIGAGHLTSMDLTLVLDHQGNPNIHDNLAKVGLADRVTPVLSTVSYTWELKKVIEAQSHGNVCEPKYDFVFMDGAHFWETDACTFFLVMKLLKPGGWILFDDYMWSVDTSDWWHKAPEMQDKPKDFRAERQVERIVTLLVSQHPDIETVLVRDNWAWAKKRDDAQTKKTPTVFHLTKTIAMDWLRQKLHLN
ncbi:MAG: class I SAM-dependent methyltransferase [Kiritimatiellae bacterium]|nr:class I SAM-dependent methyltransferase [Kiritimatiellia bacterium]